MTLPLRALRIGAALGLIAFAGSACDGDLTELEPTPDPFLAVRCQMPSGLLAEAPAPSFGMDALRPALEHVAGPMASALGDSEQLRQLIKATEAMASPPTLDTACRLLILASQALDELPETPETLPDREGIRLILLMSVGAIQAGKL